MTKAKFWASLLIAILFFAFGAMWLAPAAPAQDQHQHSSWQLIRALYGFRSSQTDVTGLLRDLISRGGVDGRIAVNNQTMGGDPAVGRDKTLRIFARNRANERHEFDFGEGSFIPADMFTVGDDVRDHREDRGQFHGGDDHGYQGDHGGDDHFDHDRDRRHRLEILWGFYGVQRHEANVTGLLQNIVDHGRLSIAVNNNSMGGDPAVGADKVLVVVYRFDGVEQAAAVPEGGLLSIP